jgi:hypothetical protein
MDQDMHAEGGDDIMLLGAGVQRSEGMAGFDWSIHKLDPLPGNSDMNLVEPAVPALPVANRDRFRQIEGLSGWFRDDILRGDDADAAVLAPGNVLTPEGVARIAGLQDVLGGATTFNAGNIILGGAGSDLLEGRGGDDILDGDRWLDAQVSVRDRLDPTIELRRVDSLSAIRADVIAGTINPGQLRIVRQIRTQAPGADIDTAVFSDVRANYLLVTNADGSRTVAQIAARAGRPTVDGVDTLRNIERLQFADVTIDLATGAAVGPAVTLSAASATFADRAVGTVSAFQAVTLTNTGTAPLNITGLALAGANPGDFNRGGTCSTSTPIAAGASCTIEVNFAPTAIGPRSASVDITSNAAVGSPHSIALSGNGTGPAQAPAVSLSAATATFADQTVGLTSAAQTVTLTNTGNAPLSITGIALAGANPGDFTRGGTCNPAPPTIAAGESCTITAGFAPTATGPRSASVEITSNAVGTPHSIALSGNGTAPVPLIGAEVLEPSVDFNAAGLAEAFQVTASTTGTLSTLRVFVEEGSAATTMIAGLYANSATGHPGTLLGRGTLSGPVAGTWNNVALANPVSVTAGEVLWIALLSPAGAGELRFRDRCCGGGQPAETSAGSTLTTLPATWSTGQTFLDGPAAAVGLGGTATGGGTPPPPPPPPPPPAPPAPPTAVTLFGAETILPSADNNVAGSAEAFRITASASGSLTTLRVFVDAPSAATTLIAGLYTDNAGHPGTLLTQGTLNNPTNDQWNNVTVPAASLTAGTVYWVALLSPAGSGTLAFRDRCCGGADPSETSQEGNLTSLPAAWTTGTVFHDGPVASVGIG